MLLPTKSYIKSALEKSITRYCNANVPPTLCSVAFSCVQVYSDWSSLKSPKMQDHKALFESNVKVQPCEEKIQHLECLWRHDIVSLWRRKSSRWYASSKGHASSRRAQLFRMACGEGGCKQAELPRVARNVGSAIYNYPADILPISHRRVLFLRSSLQNLSKHSHLGFTRVEDKVHVHLRTM